MLPSNSPSHQQGDSSGNISWQNCGTTSQYSSIAGGRNTCTNNASVGENQDALLQLQHNLMVLLQQQQQQQEQSPNIAGTDLDSSFVPQPHPQQQGRHSTEDTSRGLSVVGFAHNAPAATLSASDMLIEQYRQLFGTSFDGSGSQEPPTGSSGGNQHGGGIPSSSGVPVAPGGRNSFPTNVGSSSPLFALGATVKPLSSGNSVDDQSSPACGLQLSESSSDFMMKLFQLDSKHGNTDPSAATEGQFIWNQQPEGNRNNNCIQDNPTRTPRQGSGMTNTGIGAMVSDDIVLQNGILTPNATAH
jgi:hypothetical protein